PEMYVVLLYVHTAFFFFQAEDGIRDRNVTGVQTCALPIYADARSVLTGWTAPDAGQEELRSSYLAHLEEHGDAMRRECLPGHLRSEERRVGKEGRPRRAQERERKKQKDRVRAEVDIE